MPTATRAHAIASAVVTMPVLVLLDVLEVVLVAGANAVTAKLPLALVVNDCFFGHASLALAGVAGADDLLVELVVKVREEHLDVSGKLL